MRPTLYLVYGDQAFPLDRGSVTLGRLESCDLPLEGLEVSRRHARIHATPEGPLLLDRSRHGTELNGAALAAPALLTDGDRLRIGRHHLLITSVPWEHGAIPLPAERREGLLTRIAAWRRRYGTPELVGLVAAVAGGLGAFRLTESVILGAVAATAMETVFFYSLLAARDRRAERREQARGPEGLRPMLRELHLEFGAADAVDTLFLRPACYALGLATLGGLPGLLAGALAADLLFWGPVLRTFHWRFAARPARGAGAHGGRPTSDDLPLSEITPD